MAASLAVIAQKGGVGKTTLALHLGAAFHLRGSRTLVLDLDKQKSAWLWYNACKDASLNGLDVREADRTTKIQKLEELCRGRDIAILDCPPRLNDVTQAACLFADVALIPLRASALDMWALDDTLDDLDEADKARARLAKRPVQRLFVVNQADRRSANLPAVLDAIRKLGRVAPCIGQRISFSRAIQEGSSVLTIEPNGKAAQEIWDLWSIVEMALTLNGGNQGGKGRATAHASGH